MGLSVETTNEKLVELAIQEGHDADIPSNEGFVKIVSNTAINTSPTSPTSALCKDIEKVAGRESSSTTPSRRSADSTDAIQTQEAQNEANVVWWDGEDDPENPMNWSSFRRWGAIAVVSGVTFLTPLGSAIFAPGIPQVMEEFHSTSELLTGFVVSVYVLGFAFGPLGKRLQKLSSIWTNQ
jgi:hypothetical protein